MTWRGITMFAGILLAGCGATSSSNQVEGSGGSKAIGETGSGGGTPASGASSAGGVVAVTGGAAQAGGTGGAGLGGEPSLGLGGVGGSEPVEPIEPVRGDVDGDGCTTYADYYILVFNYGYHVSSGGDPRVDLVGTDGWIDALDYLEIIQNWGTGCTPEQTELPDYTSGCANGNPGQGGASSGDVDGDGCYSLRDRQIMGNNYMQSTELGADERAELTGDCWVNEDDYDLLETFRMTGPACEMP